MAIRRQTLVLSALLTPVTLFLGVFFLLPLLIIALFSLLSPGLYGGVEWSFYHWNYGRIFGWADGIMEIFEPIYLHILARSLGFAAMTVLLCLILCYPVAFWVSRLPDRWKLLFLFLITLPFFSSLIVRLYAWLLILKPSGILNTVLIATGLISEPLYPRRCGSGHGVHHGALHVPAALLGGGQSGPRLGGGVDGSGRHAGADVPQGDLAANPARYSGRCGDCVHPLGRQFYRAGCAGRCQGADDWQSGGTAVPVGAQLAVWIRPFDDRHGGGAGGFGDFDDLCQAQGGAACVIRLGGPR
jgi:hypothetical protein